MKIDKLSLCRCCFRTYPSSSVNPEWPTCPDCESEAISLALEPLHEYLRSPGARKMEEIKQKIMSNTSLYEHYKKSVANRIDKLIKERDKITEQSGDKMGSLDE